MRQSLTETAVTPSPVPFVSITRSFSATPSSSASTAKQRRRHRDPYAIAQAKAKKAANLSRQEVLTKERVGSLGDPVRGVTTAFVQSFDTALPPESGASTPSLQTGTDPAVKAETDNHLNFYLTKEELARGIGRSQWLSSPSIQDEPDESESRSEQDGGQNRPRGDSADIMEAMFADESRGSGTRSSDWTRSMSALADLTTDVTPEARQKRLEEESATAEEALRRISSLSLGSSKDRLRVNKQRCIEVFGRHNTEQTLSPRLASAATTGGEQQKVERVGADTGSSEVQIAILTAKIRAVADFLETRGTMDKHNKRNLRLLVHRRAKLLKYLRRKERGGPRWQNLVEKLGLSDGTWKGEITL